MELCIISDAMFEQYYSDGYIVLEDLIDLEQLGNIQASYEATIEAALVLGRAERDERTHFLKGHRF